MKFFNGHCNNFYRVEKERKEDLAERDALSERIRMKDKEKTRHVIERPDKKVFSKLLEECVTGNNIHRSWCIITTVS